MSRQRLLATLIALAAAAPGPTQDLVVHEWGVQVLGHAHKAPLLAPAGELVAGLPAFVGRSPAPVRFELVGWDKPVVHLYGAPGTKVRVRIGTPLGVPVAYHPAPRLGAEKVWGASRKRMAAGWLRFASGMEWSGTLRAAQPKDLPPVPEGHWWHTARRIPSSFIETGAGVERFLFYEATARQAPVITAAIDAKRIHLRNRHDESAGPVVILAHDGDRLRGVVKRWVPPGDGIAVPRAELRRWQEADVLAACRKQWEALGMTAAEAAAIVEIWKPDLVARLGVLVIGPMPRKYYDEMFPIEIEPQPRELVRAGLVFDTLAGQAARGAWLPGLDASLRRLGGELAAPDAAVRDRARTGFRAAADLALPLLDELAGAGEAPVAAHARDLAREIRARADRGSRVRPTKANAEKLVEQLVPPVGRRR